MSGSIVGPCAVSVSTSLTSALTDAPPMALVALVALQIGFLYFDRQLTYRIQQATVDRRRDP